MIKTIKFLHPDREIAETISKPQLIKETVFSIERLLPENCRYCNEVYATKHGIQPPLQCYHCKQGIHENCSKLVDIPEIPQIPGLIWLCGYCQPRVTFTASSTVYTGKATTSLGKTKSTPSVISSVKNPNTAAEDKVILKEDERPSDKSGPDKSEKPNHTKCSDEKQVCKFFINGKCKYGISGKGCSNKHPRICRKLHKFGTQSQKGCNKGSNCEFFHPRMCKDSVRKRLCLNQECTFMHIRGTKRKL